jgi:16S rRNA processing protein RimM
MTAEQAGNPEDAQAWVWLARIRRVQGRKGEVLADLLTDFPEKFSERKRVWLLQAARNSYVSSDSAAREIGLENFWLPRTGGRGHGGDVVLHFAGVDSINEAEKLRGLVVAIPRAERAPLGEDEVYAGDLIGCSLVDVAVDPERVVGVIEDVDREAGPVTLLVVRGEGSDEILVPFAKAYLRRIDLEDGPDGKRVEMALPVGLVELQVSGSENPEKTH